MQNFTVENLLLYIAMVVSFVALSIILKSIGDIVELIITIIHVIKDYIDTYGIHRTLVQIFKIITPVAAIIVLLLIREPLIRQLKYVLSSLQETMASI